MTELLTTAKQNDFDWESARCIGQGAIARVFLLKHKKQGVMYAVKQISKHALVQHRKVDAAFAEKACLAANNDTPRVVRLHTTFQSDDSLFFVLDYLPRGNVEMLVLREGPLPVPLVAHICACIVTALEGVHRKGFVVRDVKPENCCFEANGFVSLVDFDTALKSTGPPIKMTERTRSINELTPAEQNQQHSAAQIQAMRRKTEMFAGTAQYISPEMLDSCDYSHASDLWALGCVLYLISTGRPAFNAPSQFEVFRKVVYGNIKWPSHMPPVCLDLCKRLLITDPTQRIGVVPGPSDDGYLGELKAHALFEGIDWARYTSPTPAPFDFPPGFAAKEDGGYLNRLLDPQRGEWDPWADADDLKELEDRRKAEADEAARLAAQRAEESDSPSPSPARAHRDPAQNEEGGEEEGDDSAPPLIQFANKDGGTFVFPAPLSP
eukprot:Hpha_TRINITY_DN35143_c0_g1::TRINITY_DN35143_c0_g1_i1::g.168439::m.168439/K06276/PDPK1; 3-phosphoinositide dependent protein kinase-1